MLNQTQEGQNEGDEFGQGPSEPSDAPNMNYKPTDYYNDTNQSPTTNYNIDQRPASSKKINLKLISIIIKTQIKQLKMVKLITIDFKIGIM